MSANDLFHIKSKSVTTTLSVESLRFSQIYFLAICLFYNNCYFGLWKNGIPNDPNKLIADPLFIAPGTGKEGFSSLTGYQLQSDSPCINAGFYIPLSGKYDFWGNPIEDGLLDVGVYEQIGTGVFANKIKMKEDAEKYKKESDSAWLRWNSNGSEN